LPVSRQPEVFQDNQAPHIPSVSGIGEREHLARPPCRLPEQRLRVRVAADDAVESHHFASGRVPAITAKSPRINWVGRDPYCDPISRRATSK